MADTHHGNQVWEWILAIQRKCFSLQNLLHNSHFPCPLSGPTLSTCSDHLVESRHMIIRNQKKKKIKTGKSNTVNIKTIGQVAFETLYKGIQFSFQDVLREGRHAAVVCSQVRNMQRQIKCDIWPLHQRESQQECCQISTKEKKIIKQKSFLSILQEAKCLRGH